MIENLRPARPAVAVLLVLAVVAVACGEQEASLPIEPAGPRPATSTTTAEAAPEVVVEVPTVTPPTEPEAVLVAVEAPPATTAPDPDVVVTTQPEAEEGFVVMNTWVDDPTVTAEAPTTTLAPTTTAAPTTTTTEAVPVSTIVVVPATTTTMAPPTSTTTTTTTTLVPVTTSTTGAPSTTVVPPIPRVGDEGVPEVNDHESNVRPVEVDLSWFPEMKNVITWEDWNRVDEAATPEWDRYDSGNCAPRRWWSYPLTIQVGTVIANAPLVSYCDFTRPQSYVVTRMYPLPVCENEDQRGCSHSTSYEGLDLWQIVVCGYTFGGSIADFGISYRAGALRQDDGRFRVFTNSLYSPRECNR